MRLENRVALVTGASSGIGRGIALELARQGACLVVADIDPEPKRGKYHQRQAQRPTADEIVAGGGQALFVGTDMAQDEAVKNLIDRTVDHFGQLDILVNNAGIYIPGDSQSLPLADWDRVVGINLRAIFVATKFALPHLRAAKAGRIVNIASVHAFGGGGGPPYAAAKAGLVNLTRDTALEGAPQGVTVNAICPGYIETPIQDYLTSEQIEAARQGTPLPRFGTPKDIGLACAFLASDDAEWITGVALPVDGGWLAPIM
ncbi:MAG: glucose 1-dehydrogenase [Candidatus Latescibacteria bacterium]|nr:glucose 1-dehydrogenase [Candidatus Latescibacterota bacterium]